VDATRESHHRERMQRKKAVMEAVAVVVAARRAGTPARRMFGTVPLEHCEEIS
jgi:hypothetical protein